MVFGFFKKKSCALCGREGRLGNNTLPDENVVCDGCIEDKSPYIVSIKRFDLGQVKQHLAEREENRQKLAGFRETRVVGSKYKLRMDEDQGLWLISKSDNYRNENPDVFTLQQVTGCTFKVDEDRTEKKRRKSDGGYESYNPPIYEYRYDFDMTIYVNTPWFSEIKFKVNSSNIEEQYSVEYMEAEREANEIKRLLTEVHTEVRQAAKETSIPKTSVVCPSCQATTVPDAQGRCEFCSGAVS